MTSQERVLAACAFRRPDRIPRFDSFWAYPDVWRARLGDPADLTDIVIWYPDETPFPSHARALRAEDGWVYEADGWGRITRRRPNGYFSETLEVAIPAGVDPDTVEFESPERDLRYERATCEQASSAGALEGKMRHCIFGKTGGPYLRSTYVRGETQFLIDIAGDPPLAAAIAGKVGDHLAAVGVSAIRRWGLQDTGIWIYDDMAHNRGPMFRPASFEKIFLPVYRRMIKAYKDAGARYVFLHSDGDIRAILDMLVDAGIDGINPLERRANMDPATIRARYPRLVLTGGMCNTDTLINGPEERIRHEACELIEMGRDGGVVIGTHSVSPEIPLENFVIYDQMCRTYGNFMEA